MLINMFLSFHGLSQIVIRHLKAYRWVYIPCLAAWWFESSTSHQLWQHSAWILNSCQRFLVHSLHTYVLCRIINYCNLSFSLHPPKMFDMIPLGVTSLCRPLLASINKQQRLSPQVKSSGLPDHNSYMIHWFGWIGFHSFQLDENLMGPTVF